jgi:hypothetical protein
LKLTRKCFARSARKYGGGEEHTWLDRFDWFILDDVVLLGLIADFMHIFEEPGRTPTLLQYLCMVNFLKMWRWIVGPTLRKRKPSFRVLSVKLVISVFLVTHVCAVIFALTAVLEKHNGMPTWADAQLDMEPRSCLGLYWEMFYFASYTISTVGHGDIVPQGSLERALNSTIMILTTLYFGEVGSELVDHCNQ